MAGHTESEGIDIKPLRTRGAVSQTHKTSALTH